MNQRKVGKTAAGSQKYKCKKCGKYYTQENKKKVHSKEAKNQAIKLYLERNSARAVGQILGIRKNMCRYWIRKYAKNIEPKVVSNGQLDVLRPLAKLRELFKIANTRDQRKP